MLQFRDKKDAEINLDYKPSDEVAKDREHVYRRYQQMKEGRTYYGIPLETKWDQWEKQYEAWRPPKEMGDWQSNIVPPFTTAIVEKELAEIVNQTVRPKAIPRGPEDKYKAQLINYIIKYTWDIGYGDLELFDSLKQCLVLGNSVWQDDFWIDKRIVKLLKQIDIEEGKQKLKFEEKPIFDFNDVYGETFSIRNFFIDPGAETVNRGKKKANDAIRRHIMNYDTFMETFKGSIYDMFGDTQHVKVGVSADYYQYYTPPSGINEDQVEVLFYWGRRPDKLMVVANDVVIYDGPNPYNHKQLPFAVCSDITRLRGIWARGESELLESIQDELTTGRRMRIDRNHMDLFKMFLISNRESLDDDEGIVAPSRFMYVDDPKNIVPLEYREISQSAYMEEDRLKADGREVTGVTSPQPSGTATEAAIFKESTMKTLQTKVWRISREFIYDIMALRVPNIIQLYSAPKIDQIVGEEKAEEFRRIRTKNIELKTTKDGKLIEERKKGIYFYDVKAEDITPKYSSFDLEFTGDPDFPLSKPLRQQQLDKFMSSPISQAAIQQGYWDIKKVADKYAEEYDFDPDDLKANVEEEEESMVNDKLLIELAGKENELMLGGNKIPPTPYAIKAHTMLHLAFMDSEAFKKAAKNPEILRQFMEHIMGEDTAQRLRGGQEAEEGMAPEQGSTTSEGIMNSGAKAANPAKMMGAEMTPQGMMEQPSNSGGMR